MVLVAGVESKYRTYEGWRGFCSRMAGGGSCRRVATQAHDLPGLVGGGFYFRGCYPRVGLTKVGVRGFLL